jgi:Spy/CpxP family protein refolding chaperone
MQRLAPVFPSLFTFVLAGLLAVAVVHVGDANAVDAEADASKAAEAPKADAPKADAPKADAPEAGRGKDPIPGGPNDKDALWWNDPKIVKALSLTDEQRKKMGEHLKAYRKKVPESRNPKAFHETLVQGDWKAAHGESEKLAKGAEASVRMRGELKIDILSLLSKKQRETLVDQYPRLIYKRWLRAMRGASPR